MKINRTLTCACSVVLVVMMTLLTSAAEAQEREKKPTTQPRGRFGLQRPSDEEIFGPGPGGNRERGPGGYGGTGAGRRGRGWIDSAEWAQAEAFLKESSPRRWAAFERVPGDNPHRLSIMRALYGRYRMLQNVREDDPALYELRVQRVGLEDNVFGLVYDLKHEEAPEAKQKLETDLKARVVELVDVGIQERGRRIERLEESLKDEKERFARDQNNRDGLVQEHLDRILRNGEGDADPMRPPSPGEQSRAEETTEETMNDEG